MKVPLLSTNVCSYDKDQGGKKAKTKTINNYKDSSSEKIIEQNSLRSPSKFKPEKISNLKFVSLFHYVKLIRLLLKATDCIRHFCNKIKVGIKIRASCNTISQKNDGWFWLLVKFFKNKKSTDLFSCEAEWRMLNDKWEVRTFNFHEDEEKTSQNTK